MQRSRKRRKTVREHRATNVEQASHKKHQRKAHSGRKFAPMRSHEQSDSGSEENPAEGHGEKNRPPESGAPFLPGLKSKNARSGLCIDQTSLGPPLNPRFESGTVIHGFSRPSVGLRADSATYNWSLQNAMLRPSLHMRLTDLRVQK